MAINFGGVASGLDTNGIISGLLKAERIPLDQLTTQKTQVTGARDALSTFLSKVSSLTSQASALSDSLQFASVKASSTDTAVVASTTGAATPGSYSIEVLGLAKEQRTKSNTFSSSTDGLGMSGTLGIQIGSGSAVNVNVSASDSLTTIASKITSSGARVTASVLYDGSQYRLMVRGIDTGASNGITFSEGGTSLGLSTPANTYQGASDAQLKIDGINVTRSTNAIAGAIPGVTFAVTKTTTAPATVSVASDPDGLAKKIGGFISAYNDVISSAHLTAGYGTVKASNALLAGDSSIRTVLDRISRAVTDPVAGATGKFTTLASVGVSLTRDGTLSLDSTKLTNALSSDAEGVQRLFVTNTTTSAKGFMGQLKTTLDGFVTGPSSLLQGRISSMTKRADDMDKRVSSLQTRLDAYETTIRKQFTQLELTVSDYQFKGNAITGLFGSGS